MTPPPSLLELWDIDLGNVEATPYVELHVASPLIPPPLEDASRYPHFPGTQSRACTPSGALASLPKTHFARPLCQAGQTWARELEGRIKDLEAIISLKDSHAQALDSAIQGLETEKRRLEATIAANKPQIDADRAALKKLREENNGAHTQALSSKIQTLEADKRKLEEIAAAERGYSPKYH
ncbi:hypothetical protein F5876DRAFT_84593 [Lentinula aff. lateritia]|uniref:Uncharacterized protein n=1 Tax=Lentinula aff. lateritia TaxID=2804960 RepID=A0ACC1TG52_9AGAR|nr:hypothetical protein F5876DRAFT_84593 [Lentinula aff. lateritia]